MYTLNSKLILGLFGAVTMVLCTPVPSPNPSVPNLNSQNDYSAPLPGFNSLGKRNKADAVQKVRAVIDTGTSGLPKLLTDLQNLQKDIEGIIKQLKGAGLIPGGKADQKSQDLKKADDVSAVAVDAGVKLGDADSVIKTDLAPKLPEITLPSIEASGTTIVAPAAPDIVQGGEEA